MRRAFMIAPLALAILACDSAPPATGEGEEGDLVVEDSGEVVDNSGLPGVTPMSERVAVLGVLNKRNNLTRDIELRPGQQVRLGDAVVRLRACETTAPWEDESWTGAFVQLDVESRASGRMERVFSGWLYKESPSLNVVEHQVYDVWPKSCAMSFPDGPEAPSGASSGTIASSAPNRTPSPPSSDDADPLAPLPADSASDSN